MPSPVKKFRKLALLAKIEVTYGTDSVPTGAANAMVVSDVEITPLDGEEVERNNVQPYFGNSGVILANQFSRLRFNVELAGSGVAGTAPKWAPLIRACAVSVTVNAGVNVICAPITNSLESVSIYANVDGVNQVMPGVRGNCRVVLPAKGKPMLQFEFIGMWAAPTDVALPTVSYTGWVAPVAVNKANTIATLHGTVVAMNEFNLDLGNAVVKRDLTDIDEVEIMDRKSNGNIVFQQTTVAVKNWVQVAQQKVLGNLSIVHGTVAGNICTIGATGTCELGKTSYQNIEGVQFHNMPLAFRPTSNGNDEWSITLT